MTHVSKKPKTLSQTKNWRFFLKKILEALGPLSWQIFLWCAYLHIIGLFTAITVIINLSLFIIKLILLHKIT